MLLPAVLLFLLFLVLSAFFSSSETAFVASNPYTLESLEAKGSKKARLVRRVVARIDGLLATILIGNTLVNAAAASVATTVFVSFIPNKNEAVLLATLATTLLLLFFGEINPKTFAAHNPVKTAFLFIHPIRFLMAVFSPLVRVLSFLSRLIFPFARGGPDGLSEGDGGGGGPDPARLGRPGHVVAPAADDLRDPGHRLAPHQGDHGPPAPGPGHRGRRPDGPGPGDHPLGRVFQVSRLQGPDGQHRRAPPRQGHRLPPSRGEGIQPQVRPPEAVLRPRDPRPWKRSSSRCRRTPSTWPSWWTSSGAWRAS